MQCVSPSKRRRDERDAPMDATAGTVDLSGVADGAGDVDEDENDRACKRARMEDPTREEMSSVLRMCIEDKMLGAVEEVARTIPAPMRSVVVAALMETFGPPLRVSWVICETVHSHFKGPGYLERFCTAVAAKDPIFEHDSTCVCAFFAVSMATATFIAGAQARDVIKLFVPQATRVYKAKLSTDISLGPAISKTLVLMLRILLGRVRYNQKALVIGETAIRSILRAHFPDVRG